MRVERCTGHLHLLGAVRRGDGEGEPKVKATKPIPAKNADDDGEWQSSAWQYGQLPSTQPVVHHHFHHEGAGQAEEEWLEDEQGDDGAWWWSGEWQEDGVDDQLATSA